jgi:hypothetical protein
MAHYLAPFPDKHGLTFNQQQEPYRRQGLAKKLAAKLLREKSTLSANDGLIAADVSPTNVSSRAMCKALGGKPDWTTSW